MSIMKQGRPKKTEDTVEDPKVLLQVLRLLLEAETEFFIKVEGTSTLPYASCIQALDQDHGQFILKLVRPLPHEMMKGAQFRMLFAAGDQRYEALIEFMGREAYLQYRFDLPIELVYADRRGQKRFPFRPRENAYVTASDGGIPGLGLAGPLVNISLGGLAIRVDRVLKLDDGMRIPPNTSRFERGMFFPRIRIQDLPRLPILEIDGRIAHATEHGSEILVGFAFRELDEEQARQLGDCLRFREKILKSHGPRTELPDGGPGDSERQARSASREELPESESEIPAPAETRQDPMQLLQRKTARLCLFSEPNELLDKFKEALWHHGYHRVEVFESLASLAEDPKHPGHRADLLLLDLGLAQVGDAEPLAAVRQLEHETEFLKGKTRVILCDSVDPIMFLGQAAETRFLPLAHEDAQRWIEALDGFLGISTHEVTPVEGA